MDKKQFLKETIEHIDIKSFDSTPIINGMKTMSFTSRDTARAAAILRSMVEDRESTNILTIAGSTGAGGCLHVFNDMLRSRMADVVVATGASVVDMDFFEALGFRHYSGRSDADDRVLRKHYIDRIYDTYIDEEELQECDRCITGIADSMKPGVYSSREFIIEMGRFLRDGNLGTNSLVRTAFEMDIPVFCPAFSDSSAGFGLVRHQWENPDSHVSIDSVKDFRELTMIKMKAPVTGLMMIGGGVPKNFAQDSVVCAEILGHEVPMHRYAVQITVADPRDGACSGSTLREATSWGKVETESEQMVYAEAGSVLPLIASYVYHNADWKGRREKNWNKIFKTEQHGI